MRRNNRHKIKFGIKQIVIVFSLTLLFISVGYSLLYDSLSVKGKGNLVSRSSDKIKFSYTSDSWYNAGIHYYNYNATLTNLTNEPITGWTITIDVPNDVENVSCWNATCTVYEGKLTIVNADYNSVLTPNVDVGFGMQLSSATPDLKLENIMINGSESGGSTETPGGGTGESGGGTETPGGGTGESGGGTETPGGGTGESGGGTETPGGDSSDGITTSIALTASWQYGDEYAWEYSFTINNNSGVDIKTWSFDFSALKGTKIIGLWGSNYIIKDNLITISNGDWNGNISDGSSLTIKCQLTMAEASYNPTIIAVRGT